MNRSFKTIAMMICAFITVVQTQSIAQSALPVAKITPATIQVPAAIPLDETSERYAVVDVLKQEFTVWKGGKPVLTSACGTGRSFRKGDPQYTPTGNFKVRYHEEMHINHQGQKMPKAMCIFEEEGIFIHGTESKIWLKNPDGTKKGIRQSGGCIRLPDEAAAKAYDLLKDGDSVIIKEANLDEVVKSLGYKDFFADKGDDEIPVMKVMMPRPSADDVAKLRQAWIDKTLFLLWDSKWGPTTPTNESKLFVGFPDMPQETWIPFQKFKSLILRPGETLTID